MCNRNQSGILTPERPNKKFRNESSPFKGASLAKSLSVAVWEWSSGLDDWTSYDPLAAALLESAFCVQDSVILPGIKSYVVDLRRFVQKNLQTGKERPVRRRLIDVPVVPDPPFVPEIHYDGQYIYMNKLPGIVDVEKVISFSEILGAVDQIEAILLSAYGTDIEWLLSHFVRGKTSITLIDQPPRDEQPVATSMYPLGKLWPNFQVIHPKFLRKDGLFGMGTMHAKLMLIKYPKFLRIVVSSANLEQYDWEKITQNIWLVDVFPNESVGGQFGTDLNLFLSHLISTDSPYWTKLISEWESFINASVPANVFLIPSVPGAHRSDNFGLKKLSAKIPVETPIVTYQMSSIGMLNEGIINQFCSSLKTNSFRLVWPEYDSAMWMEGKDHLFLTERNNSSCLSSHLDRFVPLFSRSKILNHSKIMIGHNETKNFHWIYAGSHNQSMAAWGKQVRNTELHVASFELGILLIPSLGTSCISLPFVLTNEQTLKPWIREKFNQTVSQESELKRFLKNRLKDIALIFSTNIHIEIPDSMDRFNIYELDKEYETHLRAYFNVPEGSSELSVVVLKAGSDLELNTVVLGKATNQSEMDTIALCVDDKKNDDEEESDCENDTEKYENSAIQYVVDNNIDLICLDVDGTLVESNKTSELLLHAREFLHALAKKRPQVKLALVTNQGAVGLKYWMETNRFGEPHTLPSQAEVEDRIAKVKTQVDDIFPNVNVFMAFRYQSKSSGRWGPAPNQLDPRWTHDWRKPGPGMIRQAIKAARVSPFSLGKVLMVGDMDADEGAAKAAGVRFKRAPEFFIV